MDRFDDMSAHVADRDSLRARLREDGCVFFRGLLDAARVHALREDVLHAIGSRGWLAEAADPLDALGSEPARQEGRDGWWEGYTAIQSLESFHALAHEDALLSMLRTLVADDVMAHPRKIARVIWPQRADFTTPAHQDFTHIQGTTDCFTCWIPLGACPADVGGLRILRGSQSGGIRQLHQATGAGGVGTDVADDDPAWATADYEAGDVVCFHSMVVHAGLPNTSARLRLSVDYRYQSASEPITGASLKPHFFPRVADWPELTRGWSATRWIEHPASMQVAGFQRPGKLEEWHTELSPAPSKFVRTA